MENIEMFFRQLLLSFRFNSKISPSNFLKYFIVIIKIIIYKKKITLKLLQIILK